MSNKDPKVASKITVLSPAAYGQSSTALSSYAKLAVISSFASFCGE